MPASVDLKPALDFLSALRRHNHKAWFDAHRAEYDAARAAFAQLVDGLIDEFRAADQLHDLTAPACLTRIYRDVRFSKDKAPYKTNLAALIGPGGWKGRALGYYLSLEPGDLSITAGGLYAPTPAQLERFRQAIAADAAPFKKLMHAKGFVQTFGAVEGERLKTAPKGYDRAHPELALLQLKTVTAVHHFSDQDVLAGGFARAAAQTFRAMRPFLDYLSRELR